MKFRSTIDAVEVRIIPIGLKLNGYPIRIYHLKAIDYLGEFSLKMLVTSFGTFLVWGSWRDWENSLAREENISDAYFLATNSVFHRYRRFVQYLDMNVYKQNQSVKFTPSPTPQPHGLRGFKKLPKGHVFASCLLGLQPPRHLRESARHTRWLPKQHKNIFFITSVAKKHSKVRNAIFYYINIHI